MEERVYGLENEYALLYEGTGDEPAPLARRTLYEHLEAVIRERYPTLPARGVKGGVFLGNGSLLHYEARLETYDQGLAEFNTPECRSARELCTYHRTIDEMLRSALPKVEARLRDAGYHGHVTIAKANVDRDGRTFGASENYLVDDHASAPLWCARALGQSLFLVLSLAVHLLSLLPVLLAGVVLVMHLVLGVVLLPLGLLAALSPGHGGFVRVSSLWERLTKAVMGLFDSRRTLSWLGAYTNAIFFPLAFAYGVFARAVFLRRFRHLLVPFLVSRTVLAGNGHIDFTRGRRYLRISSRADAIAAVCRVFWNDAKKPILDIKHLFLGFKEPWRRYKRLAVLYSDGHLCERALLVTTGATGLVLEAIEGGAFEGAAEVRLADPIEALHAVSSDPSLRALVTLDNGEELTAIALQRRYLTIVKGHLSRAPIVDLRKFQIVQLWEAMLFALEDDPDSLVGSVDWITKRFLLEEAAGDAWTLEELADWAHPLSIVDRAGLTDQDLDLTPEGLWQRLAEHLPPPDLRALDEALSKELLDRARLGEMARLGYRLRKIDFKYHDLHDDDGYASLLERAGVIDRVVSDAEIEHAREEAPRDTRAFARGEAITRAARAGHRGKASWAGVVDYDAKESLRLPDPLSPEPHKKRS